MYRHQKDIQRRRQAPIGQAPEVPEREVPVPEVPATEIQGPEVPSSGIPIRNADTESDRANYYPGYLTPVMETTYAEII